MKAYIISQLGYCPLVWMFHSRGLNNNDLVYFSRCPSTNCTDSYIGETARRLIERVMDHAGRDAKSHIVRHCLNSNYETVNIENFKILNMGYDNNTYKKRISEALFVKQYRPSLNGTPSICETILFLCSFLIDFNCVSMLTL